MQAGKLRHRLTIQYPDYEANDIDEKVATWKDLATVWGSIEPLRGTTYFAAKQANAKVDGKITMRYKDVKPTYRITWQDREGNMKIFNIVAIIQPQQKGIETQIYYSEAAD
jgi:SPP1 family predicted phage head-tail adaptor